MKKDEPGLEQRPTVAIETVVTSSDVPMLLFPPDGEQDLELRLLLAAIDGESTIKQIAEVAGVDPKHAQAVFAQLKAEGCISILSAKKASPAGGAAAEPARAPVDPFQGLKPRTR